MNAIIQKIGGSSTAWFSLLLPIILSVLQALLAKVGITISNDLIVAATVGGGIGYGYKEGQAKTAAATVEAAKQP